ncbi:GIY-YIG nuclease family protein [Thalassotalea sp. PLHSN55]|uniref:GIY-YIG nuclease family protein n=1 Tax=Thalassotalea sp. PLHSN55 TaxID=3435888 RepID=UPI003F84C2FE
MEYQHRERQSIKLNSTLGNVYVMTHSFFSDVIRIGCTSEDPLALASLLSERTPGQYSLYFTLNCLNAVSVNDKLQSYLALQKYTNEFYSVTPEEAQKLLIREAMRIPTLSTH